MKFELKANILTRNMVFGKGVNFCKKINFDNFLNNWVLESSPQLF